MEELIMENMYLAHIIAPKTNSFVAPVIAMAFLSLLIVSCIGIMYYMRNTTISISNEHLNIKTIFYGKNIPINEINIDGIRKLNLYENNEYNIKRRINGIGLPNYYVGWMTLNNGNKSLVYLTDRKNVVLIPVRDYDVLISLNDYNGIKDVFNKIKDGM
jgi:hypothetical protein